MRCFTAMLVAVIAATPKAEWRYHESTDLMDDSRFVVALSPQVQSSTPADHNPEATLRVGCYTPDLGRQERGGVVEGGQARHVVCTKGVCRVTAGYVLQPSLWATYLNLDDRQGRVRFDGESPVAMRALADRGNDVALLRLTTRVALSFSCAMGYGGCHGRSRGASDFISRLLLADQVLVELPQYGSNPVFKFPVGEEGRGAIRKVINACDIAEASVRTMWGREGVLTLLDEQMVKDPKRAWRKRWAQIGGMDRDTTSLDDHPPLLNAKTGLVIFPYVHGDSVVSVEIDGESVVFESTAPWRFSVPVTSALGDRIDITYSVRTSIKGIIHMYGQYERQYRLSFGTSSTTTGSEDDPANGPAK